MCKYYKILFSIFFIFILFGCKNEKDNKYPKILIDVIGSKGKPIVDTINIPQNLRKIVADISKFNIYQTSSLAKGQKIIYNFENYKKLQKLASNDELVGLTNNKNLVVSLYAANALAEKEYPEIDKIFNRFINNRQSVYTENGCIVGDRNISIPFYEKYIYSTKYIERQTDKNLKIFDSIIIFNNNSNDELIRFSLQNRLYSNKFRKRIETIAFKNNNKDAILYLSNWFKADYSNQLQREFKKLLGNDSLNSFQFQTYIKELASFQNINNNKFIIEKLKKDTIWKQDETRLDMIWFLSRKGISINDL